MLKMLSVRETVTTLMDTDCDASLQKVTEVAVEVEEADLMTAAASLPAEAAAVADARTTA